MAERERFDEVESARNAASVSAGTAP
jgi:hypothetical protein